MGNSLSGCISFELCIKTFCKRSLIGGKNSYKPYPFLMEKDSFFSKNEQRGYFAEYGRMIILTRFIYNEGFGEKLHV